MTTKKEVEKNTDNGSKNKELILSVKDLRIWFKLRKFGFGNAGYVKAVDGVTFDLHKQESIAIVGESGCGKTSLMKSILGLYKPEAGSITYAGHNVAEFTKEQKRWCCSQIGYVQQDPFGAIAPFMTVRRILAEALICNGIKDKEEHERRIREVMDEVRLIPADDFINKYPHMLSGGQQQRVV
ncbi:MAG: ATP-binding cassette domain-containing protein, partial [Clostridiales bacterium]|nr:ATP-binding cassette domain-containing protein [Clostridiales bacterium]